MSAAPPRPRAAGQRARLRHRARVLTAVTVAALLVAAVMTAWALTNRANAAGLAAQLAARPTPTQARVQLAPVTPAGATPAVCVDALDRATALLDAQEAALTALDDTQPGNMPALRDQAADFDRAGLHAAAQTCRAGGVR